VNMAALAAWQNFYVIVGSSAGALIGLQFVVMTLVSSLPVTQGQADAGGAFATPTIVHFGVVLLLSAIISAPWEGISAVAVVWGLLGFSGVSYTLIVALRMRKTAYRPELEDWLFHALLPFAAYIILAISACVLRSHLHGALFGVGTTSLLLLFTGIHNAWDAVTYHVFVKKQG